MSELNNGNRRKRGRYKLWELDSDTDMPESTARYRLNKPSPERESSDDEQSTQLRPANASISSDEDAIHSDVACSIADTLDVECNEQIERLNFIHIQDSGNDDEALFFEGDDDSDRDENVGDEMTEAEDVYAIFEHCRISKKEAELLIIAYALRFNLPDIALDGMARFADCLLPEPVFKSKYKFLQNFEFPDINLKIYYFCKKCTKSFEFGNSDRITCPECGFVSKKNDSDGFFVHIPLKNQLEHLMTSNLYPHLRKICQESDIVNGSVYKALRQAGVIADNDLSIQVNVDGVTFCKSSRKNMWPIIVGVNEFNYRFRKNNLFICGLWYGNKKPPMNLYLKPFVEEMIELYNTGFHCTPFESNEEIIVKVHTLFFTVDSIARPLVQNMKQFNGKYGCNYCLQRGEEIAPLHRVYPFIPNVQCRSAEIHKEHVKEAHKSGQSHKGVKGPSVLKRLPNFDIIHGFPPDYMHAWLLGVAKSFNMEWFNKENNNEPYYLGLKFDEFNRRLLQFQPPTEITRTPQPMWHGYKANEWKNYVLYNSMVCLKDLLPAAYLKHWQLFVFSMSLLLKNQVTDDDVSLCKKALKSFVQQTESLYGKKMMRYNLHILLHTTDYVEKYGALWAWSCFPHESCNGVLKLLFHGTQYISQQICKMFSRLRFIKNKSSFFTMPERSEAARRLFIRLMKQCSIKRCLEFGNDLYVFGVAEKKKLTVTEKIVIERKINGCIKDECSSYSRFIFNKVLFHTTEYTRLQKRYNSTVLLNDNTIVDMSSILAVTRSDSNETMFIVTGNELIQLRQKLYKDGYCDSSLYSYITQKSDVFTCCDFSCIVSKCVYRPLENGNVYVVPLINTFETD